ncbi:MAG TPA: hypothetical protein VF121_02855 [Thermoanaerobaculia bacterium]|nr:hypothetical protein [Thermoanaerobaculia bacterium]
MPPPRTDITGFFFRRGGSIVVSSYGHGLWEIEVDWRDKAVFLVLRGRINGVVVKGNRVEAVTVTPGSRVLQYVPEGAEIQEWIPVREAKRGAGFKGLRRVLGCPFRREALTGLIFQEGRFVGLLSTRGELNEEASVEPYAPAAAGAPYLILTTDLALPGLPVLGGDGVLHVLGRGFRAAPDLSVEIDDRPVQAEVKLDQYGTLRMKLVQPE